MNIKGKHFAPKKELKDGKRLDTGGKRWMKGFHSKHNEKTFIRYRYICVFCYILFRHTALLQRLHSFFYKNQ